MVRSLEDLCNRDNIIIDVVESTRGIVRILFGLAVAIINYIVNSRYSI